MLRGISSTGPFGQAKQCVSNTFGTDYMLSADEVMAYILQLAHNMDEETIAPSAPAPDTSPPPISAFVAAGLGPHSGLSYNPRGPRGGRGLPNKCSAYGSLDRIMSSCSAPDDALLNWTLDKRKMIIQEYGNSNGSASAHAALMSDVPADDVDSLPTLEDCTDEYYDTEVSVPFSFVAFSSFLTPSRDLSQLWVVDSACSINLTAFRGDFSMLTPPPLPLAWVGSASTLRAVSQCGFPFGWHVATPFTARSMQYTPSTFHLALLSASGDSSVSAGCNHAAAVNYVFLVTLTMVFLLCPHEWVC
jgi:hypothetical protein